MRTLFSTSILAIFATALAACSGSDRAVTASAPELRSATCRALGLAAATPSAPMSPPLPDGGLELASDVSPLSGLLVEPDGLFLLDLALGHLWRLDAKGEVVHRMGRTGKGPAEFDAPFTVAQGGRFLARTGDTLVVFDSRTVHRFLTDGTHIDSRQVPASALSFLEAPTHFALADGAPVIASLASLVREGGKTVRLPERRFLLSRLDGDSASVVERLTLPQLPRMGSGGYFGSPAEASPVWDVREGCLALMDGSTSRLIAGDLRSGARDTVDLPLPERFADAAKANATLPGFAPGTELPPPALLARVVDLRLDPSGVLWLRPVPTERLADGAAGPESGLEVWRYDLRAGRFTIDTVSGFPKAFDPAGRGVRITTDDEGVTRLVPLARLPR